MLRKIGSNQHKDRWGLSPETAISVWQIAALTLLGVIISIKTQPKIISPVPDAYATETVNVYAVPTPQTARELVLLAGLRAFGSRHVVALESLVQKESSFNAVAVNPRSGACGLFQAWPCQKMKCEFGDADCQVRWGIDYIKSRYGNPSNAWYFHQRNGWY